MPVRANTLATGEAVDRRGEPHPGAPARDVRSALRRQRARLGSACALALAVAACSPAETHVRVVEDFNRDWRFHPGDASGAERPDFDDGDWRPLDVPHDWSIEGEFAAHHPATAGGGALPGGVGWYRKTFRVAEADTSRLVFIEFDGVYQNSDVWVNGQHVGNRPYGYSSFRYELTPYLRYGTEPNVIAVRADNSLQPNARWYTGSGIYRHVRIVRTDRLHVDHWGTFVTVDEVTSEAARLTMRTTVRNAWPDSRDVTVQTALYDADGRRIATATAAGHVPGRDTATVTHEMTVAAPRLWSAADPYLYRAVSHVLCDGRLCDDYETPVGIRTFTFTAERGFTLNGTPLKIRGVCLHHDLGALGAAFNRRALERQLEIMRGMGVNAIRTAHNPPAPELLELTDRMGFLVMNEAFDVWARGKSPYDYHLHWDEWHERDLADLVRRDRNHPSVILWSIGNEILEQWNDDPRGVTIARELAAIVRTHDPTRPVTAGLNFTSAANPVIRSGALDVIGYNYAQGKYATIPDTLPGLPFIAAETTSSLHTRGYYAQPSDSIARYWGEWADDPGPPPNPNHRLSAYDHRATGWGSLHAEALIAVEPSDHVAGMFVWTGFDYLGEPTPYDWPARSSYFGIVDLAGFPKDAYYLYKSQWTTEPVLHVFPHWNWTPGDTIDVWAYTNADEVELFLDGGSLGTRRKEDDALHLTWRVPFAPGELRAVGSTDGQEVAAAVVRTAGAAARIELSADRTQIRADRADLSFVTMRIVDRDGVLVPDADHAIRLEIEGDASLAGVDNGDQTSHAPFKADRVRAFAGLALAIVRAGDTAGTVVLTARADGLQPASVRIRSLR